MVREQRRLYCLCHGFLSTTTTTTTTTNTTTNTNTNTTTTTATNNTTNTNATTTTTNTTTTTSITTAAYLNRQHYTITCRKVLSNQIQAEVDTQLHKINTSHHRAPHMGDHV
jgi:hypothetical protein